MKGLYKEVMPGQIYSVLVAFEISAERWKAKVINGHNEDEYALGYARHNAIDNLKRQIESESAFVGHKFIELDTTIRA